MLTPRFNVGDYCYYDDTHCRVVERYIQPEQIGYRLEKQEWFSGPQNIVVADEEERLRDRREYFRSIGRLHLMEAIDASLAAESRPVSLAENIGSSFSGGFSTVEELDR